MRAATFLALVAAFPCPWYMFAVGGLLPLPVILLYGFEGGIVLAVSLVHGLGGLLAISFLPIYGSGENLAAGGKLNRNAYQAYSDAFGA